MDGTDEPEYRTRTGKRLTDNDLEALADEAERGYDVEPLLRREAEARADLYDDLKAWLDVQAIFDDEATADLARHLYERGWRRRRR